MLGIIILILKWIGIILATIIGIILLLLICVLFSPVTYKVKGEIHNKIETLDIQGSCRYLFGLLRVKVHVTSQGLQWDGKVLWFDIKKLISDDIDDDIGDIEDHIEDDVEAHIEHKIETDKKYNTVVKENIKPIETAITKNVKIDTVEDKKKDKKKTKKKWSKKFKSKKKKRKFNIIHTIRNICDKIKMLIEKKEKIVAFINIEVHQYTLAKLKRLGAYLWRKWKPKKLCIKAHIGFEDPSITGKLLGVLGVLYPLYGDTIQVEPEFNDVVYEGNLMVVGRVRLSTLVYIALKLICDKKVRETYNNIKNFEF